MSDDFVTLILRDNGKAREMYSFAFRVTYELNGSSLKVTYDAENLDKTMYCTFGAHEGHSCPEGIEECEIVFSEKETLHAYALNGNILTNYTKLIIENSNTLPLDDKYFVLDALVFRDVKSNSTTLNHKYSGRYVKVDFDDFDYLLLSGTSTPLHTYVLSPGAVFRTLPEQALPSCLVASMHRNMTFCHRKRNFNNFGT